MHHVVDGPKVLWKNKKERCMFCFIHVVYLAKMQAQVECRPAKKSIEEGLMNEVGGNKGL